MAANLSWVVLSVAVGSLVNLDPFTPFCLIKTLPDPPLPLRYDICSIWDDIAEEAMILQN